MAASVPVSNPRYLGDVTRLMSASEWRRKLESMASKRWAALLSGCAGGSTASTITTSTPGSALLSSVLEEAVILQLQHVRYRHHLNCYHH
mmetsp:Transcript_23163/g.34910  ORF Transcript_23163/g.34910 Transcript_23163/m.34910 type:complete len:90 (-) Transcript_23163:289-558(-)